MNSFNHYFHQFKSLNFKYHVICASLIRIVLIQYAVIHDENSLVQYTDVDYSVFTDAARYIWQNESPYKRHTYRYSPLIALMLTPNVFLHPTFGKYLFSLVDVVVGLLIRAIVRNCMTNYESCMAKKELTIEGQAQLKGKTNKRKQRRNKMKIDKSQIPNPDLICNMSMLLWLYNPMAIAIATRGNCDSLAGLLVLATLYLLQCKRSAFLAGLVHGFAVHLRLYPIAYSLTYFMYLSDFSYYSCSRNGESNRSQVDKRTIFQFKYLYYLIPNSKQLKLIIGCLLGFGLITAVFYSLYGDEFLHESMIYHLLRTDPRHNFSLFFYLQYLTARIMHVGQWQKILVILPQLVLLLTFSIRFGLNKFSLNFAILTETIVIVAYNRVLTSQYFVWILAILPLCLWQIVMSKKIAIFLAVVWIVAQVAWLLPAYFLEFEGHNTFLFIWMQSISFFCANIAILGRLLKSYMPSVGITDSM